MEACLLEGDSLPPESIPEGFIKVSLEELHQKGYLTAEEQLRNIPPETLRVDSFRWGCSWAKCWHDQSTNSLYYMAGSATWSRLDEKIRVRALREKITSGGVHRDSGFDTQAHAGPRNRPAAVSWQGKAYYTSFLEVRIYGTHIWKADEPDSIVGVTYARDRVER